MKNGGSGKERKYDFTSVKQTIEENLELELGPTSLRAVEFAYELARQVSIERPILTTSVLFFGMVDCGKREEKRNSARFLFERVGKIERKIKESYLINAKRNIKAKNKMLES